MKQKRRQTKRRGQMRRQNCGRTRAARLLAGAAAIAAGTQAYGSPVRFDNPPGPNHFAWQGGTYASPVWLDIQAPAANQPGAPQGVSSIGQFRSGAAYSGLCGSSPTPQLQTGGLWNYFVVPAVYMIPTAGLVWDRLGLIYYGGYGSGLPAGRPVYLGFRFDLGCGNQYAWIGAVRQGLELDAFAWGYETTPGVPILLPEPGTLAMLALGAALVGSRRGRAGDDVGGRCQ